MKKGCKHRTLIKWSYDVEYEKNEVESVIKIEVNKR